MIYVFGDYELDTDRHELRLARVPLRIEPKVFDLLAYLIQHHRNLVTREELYQNLWSDQFVSEASLSYCITEARKAVGDTGRTQHVIKTVHGRGYRFVAAVQERPDSTPVQTRIPSDMLLPAPERPGVSQEPLPPVGAAQSPLPLVAWDQRAADETEPENAAALFTAERRQLTVL